MGVLMGNGLAAKIFAGRLTLVVDCLHVESSTGRAAIV